MLPVRSSDNIPVTGIPVTGSIFQPQFASLMPDAEQVSFQGGKESFGACEIGIPFVFRRFKWQRIKELDASWSSRGLGRVVPQRMSEKYEFADFRLDVRERTLVREGAERVALPDKAFDTLCVLVRNAGKRDALTDEQAS